MGNLFASKPQILPSRPSRRRKPNSPIDQAKARASKTTFFSHPSNDPPFLKGTNFQARTRFNPRTHSFFFFHLFTALPGRCRLCPPSLLLQRCSNGPARSLMEATKRPGPSSGGGAIDPSMRGFNNSSLTASLSSESPRTHSISSESGPPGSPFPGSPYSNRRSGAWDRQLYSPPETARVSVEVRAIHRLNIESQDCRAGQIVWRKRGAEGPLDGGERDKWNC